MTRMWLRYDWCPSSMSIIYYLFYYQAKIYFTKHKPLKKQCTELSFSRILDQLRIQFWNSRFCIDTACRQDRVGIQTQLKPSLIPIEEAIVATITWMPHIFGQRGSFVRAKSQHYCFTLNYKGRNLEASKEEQRQFTWEQTINSLFCCQKIIFGL